MEFVYIAIDHIKLSSMSFSREKTTEKRFFRAGSCQDWSSNTRFHSRECGRHFEWGHSL